MKQFAFLLLTSLALMMPGICQNKEECPYQITWQGCFGTSAWDNQPSFCKAYDGGYLIMFTVIPDATNITPGGFGDDDIMIIKTKPNGEVQWKRYYGGSSADYGGYIIADGSGHYYFSGFVSSTDSNVQSYNHGLGDNWIVKIDSLGNIIWEHCFGGSGEDYPGGLRILSDGNIISYGASSSSDGDVGVNYGFLDVWLFIFTPEGEIIQSKVFGNNIHNNVHALVETRDGGFFFTSQGYPEGMIPPAGYHGDEDVWSLKLDRQFNIEWQKLFGGTHKEFGLYGMKELENGYIFLALTNSNDGDVSGLTGTPGSNSTMNIWVVRIDSNGNLIWQQCFGSGKFDYTRDIFPTVDKGFIIFGDRGASLDCYSTSGPYNDVWVIKTDSLGTWEWYKTFGSLTENSCWGVVRNDEHNWMILSTTAIGASGESCDVKCTGQGHYDVWMFELKDCDQYQPSIPTRPEGPDTLLCSVLTPLSTYTTRTVASADGYDWQLLPAVAGMTASTDTSVMVTWNPAYEGNATLKVRSLNTCGTSPWSDSLVLQVRTCIGINETNEIGFRVWPNPASDKVYFGIAQLLPLPAVITITDVTGRVIFRREISGQQLIWDTRQVSSGMYIYTLTCNGMSRTGKLVIK